MAPITRALNVVLHITVRESVTAQPTGGAHGPGGGWSGGHGDSSKAELGLRGDQGAGSEEVAAGVTQRRDDKVAADDNPPTQRSKKRFSKHVMGLLVFIEVVIVSSSTVFQPVLMIIPRET